MPPKLFARRARAIEHRLGRPYRRAGTARGQRRKIRFVVPFGPMIGQMTILGQRNTAVRQFVEGARATRAIRERQARKRRAAEYNRRRRKKP